MMKKIAIPTRDGMVDDDTVSKSILRLFQIKLQLFSLTSVLRAGVEFIYIYCAQRGVPPLAARPSLEKFFIDGHNVPVRNIAYLRTMVFMHI
jgi:hypothetical protein